MSQVLESHPPRRRSRGGSTLPPLENGDHLDQKTFHERYEAMPEDFKAELIQGRVYVPSRRVRYPHGRLHALSAGWLGHYSAATGGSESLVNTTVILDNENEPQPDCLLLVRPDHGGRTQLSDYDHIVGPPELAVEIAESVVSLDSFDKRDVYEHTGIQEYLIVIVRERHVRWIRLENGRYVDLTADEQGLWRSHAFPGLWLNSGALLSQDVKKLLDTLGQGLASPEHAEITRELAERAHH